MEVNDGHGIVDRGNSPTIPGDRHFLDPRSWVLLWQIYLQRNWLGFGHRHASGRRAHRTAWHHHLGTAEGHRLPLVSRSEEHTSELQSLRHLVCRLLLEKKKNK